MKGSVFKIESLAAHDGEGVRSAVFLSGCRLRCKYCHNPDTWQIYNGQDPNAWPMDAEELCKRLARFKPYYTDGGGVTFTGGEPFLQAEFVVFATKLLKTFDISVAVDTALPFLNSTTKQLLFLVDTVIADLKFYNQDDYIKHTGQDIFCGVLACLDFLLQINKPLILRTVIVPDVNDTADDIAKYTQIAAKYKKILKEYQLLPFSTLGFSKYDDLGINNPYKDKQPLSDTVLDSLTRLKDSFLLQYE